MKHTASQAWALFAYVRLFWARAVSNAAIAVREAALTCVNFCIAVWYSELDSLVSGL